MKRLFLLLCLSFIGFASFSQKLSFTKGEIAPGKISTGKSFEDFLSRDIIVVDDANTAYTFVRADLTVSSKDGKSVKITLEKPAFSEAQLRDVLRASTNGTTYTFSNVVVKDKSGKQLTIATVKYELNRE